MYPKKVENAVILFKDKDPKSDFYFKVDKINAEIGKRTTYSIDYKPSTRENVLSVKATVNVDDLKKKMQSWLLLMNQYNEKTLLFDNDPIINAYYDELEPAFEILDDDADYSPFNYSQQKTLISLYEDVIESIIENTTKENEDESQIIIQGIRESQELITKSTKKEVVEKFRKNLAKLRKFSIQVFEKTLVKYFSDIGKKLINGEIDIMNLLP